MQSGEWLGFDIDTRTFTFSVPQRKIDKLMKLATEELRQKRTTARNISKIAGQVISMEPGVGPIARLFSRKMYSFVDTCLS